MQHKVKVEVEKVKQRAYDDFYASLKSKERETDWLMRQRDRDGKYIRVAQDMDESCKTMVRCDGGVTEELKVEVGLHQGSALSSFLFAVVMDRLTDEARQESSWIAMFSDDIVICRESREQVEEKLERWRYALKKERNDS